MVKQTRKGSPHRVHIDRLALAHKLGATFDYQQQFIDCRDRYRTCRKARQIGMTTCLAIETLIDSILYDDYVTCIVSPSQRQSSRVMRYIKKSLVNLEKILGAVIPTEKFTSEEVFFHHGSEIHSLPNNPLGIQGIDCNNGVVDEAGLFPQNEGDAIIDALVGSLAAKQGRLTVFGRPRGKRGMLWQYWDPTTPRYKEFKHFTVRWSDRGRQDSRYKAEVERHRKILTKLQFDEIYNAEFIDEGVLMFTHEILERAIELYKIERFALMVPEGKPSGKLPRYIGMDFGRKRNLTEIHVLEKRDDGLCRTLMMKSLERMNFEDQKIYIDDLIRRVEPTTVTIDERGMGLALLDYFRSKHGERTIQPLSLTNLKTKEKIVIQCQNAFMDLKLAIPDDEELYDQLHSYQKEITDAGNIRYTGKVDETDFKDDKVVALMAAVDAAQKKPFVFGVI